MARDKHQNKNSYGTFHLKKPWTNKKHIFVYAILLLVFVSGSAIAITRKIKDVTKPKPQSVTVKTDSAIPGWWYQQYFGASACDKDICKSDADPDHDGLTNSQEFFYHSNPMNANTVKDKLNDGQLVAAGFDPSRPGHMTFDQVASDDNVVGESLVYDQDFVKTIGDLSSLNNVPIPAIPASDIKIGSDNSVQAIQAYLKASNDVMGKYFSTDSSAFIQQALASQSQSDLDEIKMSAAKVAIELKQLTVPPDGVIIQKYLLGMLQLLPNVLDVPDEQAITDVTNDQANRWYDDTRSFSYLWQQITIETTKLQNKYK